MQPQLQAQQPGGVHVEDTDSDHDAVLTVKRGLLRSAPVRANESQTSAAEARGSGRTSLSRQLKAPAVPEA